MLALQSYLTLCGHPADQCQTQQCQRGQCAQIIHAARGGCRRRWRVAAVAASKTASKTVIPPENQRQQKGTHSSTESTTVSTTVTTTEKLFTLTHHEGVVRAESVIH